MILLLVVPTIMKNFTVEKGSVDAMGSIYIMVPIDRMHAPVCMVPIQTVLLLHTLLLQCCQLLLKVKL